MLTREEIIRLLSASSEPEITALKDRAYATMKTHTGEKVYYRGIIELSNRCAMDCYYCGIRASNEMLTRYTLTAVGETTVSLRDDLNRKDVTLACAGVVMDE